MTSPMQQATSRDRQEIAYWHAGSGPPLLLVHGGLTDRTSWRLVQPILEERFTVFTMNRRGREGSGAPSPHTIENEFEDVIAVIEAIGEPVHLFGHSGGALCSMGAALLTDRLGSLMLYEPPFLDPSSKLDPATIKKLVNEGKNEEAALEFLRTGAEVPEADLDSLRASPIWPHLAALAPTMPPEFDALMTFDFDLERFRHLKFPLLLLVGGESPRHLWKVNEALRDRIPSARFVELPGQQHGAHLAAPDLLVAEVTAFLQSL